MHALHKLAIFAAIVAAACLLVGVATGNPQLWQPAAVVMCVALAIGIGGVPALAGYQFTTWIIVALVAAMLYSDLLKPLDPDDNSKPQNKWIMLIVIQTVMFGMGTQMSLRDFAAPAKMSRGVVVGLILQFSIMPIVGYTIGYVFGFDPEIAAGMVLIGSCSSGLASNVLAYMARANLALSVAVTAIGTLFAPVMTPLWMKLLASESVEVSFMSQMLTIIKIVIVPIGAALIHDYLKTSRGTLSSENGQGLEGRATSHGPRIVRALAILGIIWLAAMALGGWKYLSSQLPDGSMTALGMIGFFWASIVAGVVYHQLTLIARQIERVMPRLSMAGIIFFTAVTTAVGRDNLLAIGWLLLVAVVIHNLVGYTLGYWLSRAAGLDKNSARSVSLEVGIHNGGMAIGVASTMGKLATVGLAAAIFSPWMNISGSILANYWRKRPGEERRYTINDK